MISTTWTPEITDRYRRQFNLDPTKPITRDMIEHHFQLERRARAELLSSRPAERAAVAERWYAGLYTTDCS